MVRQDNARHRISSARQDKKGVFCFEKYCIYINPCIHNPQLKPINGNRNTLDSKVHGGQHRAHLGPTGPRWAPCWPHEFCYLGMMPTEDFSRWELYFCSSEYKRYMDNNCKYYIWYLLAFAISVWNHLKYCYQNDEYGTIRTMTWLVYFDAIIHRHSLDCFWWNWLDLYNTRDSSSIFSVIFMAQFLIYCDMILGQSLQTRRIWWIKVWYHYYTVTFTPKGHVLVTFACSKDINNPFYSIC